MNLYKYKRSRSFIGLGPRSLRFNILLFLSLETAKAIEAKFHLYPPWDGGTKVFSNGPGHMGEHGGSVVECRTPEREVRGSRPTAAVLCP